MLCVLIRKSEVGRRGSSWKITGYGITNERRMVAVSLGFTRSLLGSFLFIYLVCYYFFGGGGGLLN